MSEEQEKINKLSAAIDARDKEIEELKAQNQSLRQKINTLTAGGVIAEEPEAGEPAAGKTSTKKAAKRK